MNKLIQFLFSQMQSSTPSAVGLKRKLPLMLDDGSPSPSPPKFSHSHPIEPVHESYYIHSPSSDTASCSTDGLTGGPIISDVTDMTQASMAIQMQSADNSYGSNVPAFLTKLWTLVEDPDTNHLICWSATGTSFHVFDQGRFAKEVLPKYFKHNNMASFVRQLNMCEYSPLVCFISCHRCVYSPLCRVLSDGFRKVVNIEQSGLVKPERDDTEFQHLYFLQGHEHMLEHIKRKVSIVKSEETKVRQEDLSKLLYEVQLLRTQQDNMECQMQDMKQQKSMMLIKEEPVSPGVRGGGKGEAADGGEAAAMTSTCQVCSSEPPVLPVAMVQSVLEGRGSAASMVERRNRRPALDRAELPESVENVDMSLEELQQLLLRSHQQSAMEAGAGAAMDPFSLSLPLTEWNFTEMESNLKSKMENGDGILHLFHFAPPGCATGRGWTLSRTNCYCCDVSKP
ncbi:hypothetical protein CCH79_00013057, partial [Gambusia affinis]